MKTKYLIKKILRKIYHFIGFMTIFMICLLPVKADTIFTVSNNNVSEIDSINDSSNWNYSYTSCVAYDSNFNIVTGNSLNNLPINGQLACSSYSDCVSQVNSYISTYSNDYPYYSISLSFIPLAITSDSYIFQIYLLSSLPNSYTQSIYLPNSANWEFTYSYSNRVLAFISNYHPYGDNFIFNLYGLYDTNLSFPNTTDTYLFKGFYNNEGDNPSNYVAFNQNEQPPLLKDLLQYNSYSDYISSNNITTVNLNDYDYVLLSLKNYNQSNAFQSNLQVKGQIGITPIYNYGQTSKDSVTGVQVQDRCNASYSDYTSYPLYILQSDLQNNVVYAVKSCSENSFFKFDSNVFDITYVTQQNASDPIITINGQQYHTIPYSDLPSTATKNETDNYIPGQSVNNLDATTDGLNSALKNATNWLSSTWDMIVYFSSFVGLLFASLPTELHAILISAFTITIVIGLLKHFTG